MLDEKIIFKPAAFRHGILEEDIRKAFEQRLLDHALPGMENKYLLIGLGRNGIPLEIMYNVLVGEVINVFHAMKCRKPYLDLLRWSYGRDDG